MEMVYVFASIILLVLLISWGKVQPFLAFLVASAVAGALLGLPVDKIPGVLEKGIGNLLAGLLAIVCIGAMFGKLVANSGAAQKIALVLMRAFGEKNATWALMFTGFLVGIPLFYNVGFVLLVPLVFSVVAQTKVPPIYLGIPMFASLSVTHGFLPPHPAPTAMLPLFNADMATTLFYGFIVALPAMIIAGPVYAKLFRNVQSKPLTLFVAPMRPESELPSAFNCFATALLPVALIALSLLDSLFHVIPESALPMFRFLTNPLTVMLLSLAIATWTLGLSRGMKMQPLMDEYGNSVKDIAVILLIIAGAGTLKEVFVATGVDKQISASLTEIAINPLVLGWLIAGIIRVSLGSATVAGMTAAGLMSPVVASTGADPNLMVLAIGAGSLMFSHVNDSGFWMAKEYFNLSLKETIMSWTLMEGIVGVVGIIGVLILEAVIL
ncbi:MAG: gluconate transporter [Steroidobacteraceae bacterium]|jgi:Gnt-I system high-affinity gluconate transporter|nr:gluconate transporter [Steroidobacteraceae bacterium]